MLLLTGATGKVGRPLAEMLGARGVPFRALVRSLDRAAPLRDAGAELVEGDLARPDTLARAFDGVDRLFLLTAPAEEMVALQHNAIEAARAAGVRHVVKLSAVGAGPGDPVPVRVARWHAEIEGALRASGMAWTMIRPHGFMQNTFAFAPSVAAEGRFYAPDTGRYPVVDARDVAAVAAAALTGGAHEGAEYEVTGPERLSRAPPLLPRAAGQRDAPVHHHRGDPRRVLVRPQQRKLDPVGR